MRLIKPRCNALAATVIWPLLPETGTAYGGPRRLKSALLRADHIEAIMVAKIAERIESLETRLKQLKVKQQRVEARKRSLESRRLRRDDTRRKILVGAIVLAKVDQGALAAIVLNGWLDSALSRPEDRALFGL
jgi:hypothetical protein